MIYLWFIDVEEETILDKIQLTIHWTHLFTWAMCVPAVALKHPRRRPQIFGIILLLCKFSISALLMSRTSRKYLPSIYSCHWSLSL